ncbi:adenylate/guanylate cyclase domain-containing protein [Saxibacter everestensis]|uniref:Adenylate/guanylate cyclase domain-containing protein n=1 Tax=Saxibacter everestensis TaxID=2909229 RepID=A0ABY8QP38_9MICO|nr:adenylate/guanylate cyclase domain-containing protein [Brevibacteriaceae bacterium ZFBP1038]
MSGHQAERELTQPEPTEPPTTGDDAAEDATAEDATADNVAGDDTDQDRRLISDLRAAADKLEQRLIGGERSLRRREVASNAGVSLLSARKLWRALGFPDVDDDAVAFTDADSRGLERMAGLVRSGVIDEPTAISLTRAIGHTMDRLVVWQAETLVEYLAGARDLDDAEARKIMIAELEKLVDPLEDMLVYAWRRELASAIGRLNVRAEAGLMRDGRTDWYDESMPLARAVGFADLVSYTRLSQQMEPRQLAQLVQRFQALTHDVIATGNGRVVKTVGDEVFFAAESPESGAEIALSLAERIGADPDLPDARVSVVWGRVLSRLGDIFGSTVNLAARLTAIAEPGTVLTDASTAAALRNNDRYIPLPQASHVLQGFGSINTVVLARGRGQGLDIDFD